MTDRLAELRELEKAATPGPWAPENCYSLVTYDRSRQTHGTSDANRALIATVRNALPDLLAVVEAAREIDREGYVDAMANVPSWQRLASALAKLDGIALAGPPPEFEPLS